MATPQPQPPALPVRAPDPAAAPRAASGGGQGGAGHRLPSARIAVVMLLVAETMFFTGLVSAYLVLRFGAEVPWPPPGQPRLPLLVTAVNSLFLVASLWTLGRARAALRTGDAPGLVRGLLVTSLLGLLFVVVQGSEWARLLAHGLTLQSSTYGATFYTLIGCHAAHVAAAVGWLLGVTAHAARRGRETRPLVVELCFTYWTYVCGLWAFLFPLVYLL